jgi:hypothetical protein
VGVSIGHSPEKSTISCSHPPAKGLVGQEGIFRHYCRFPVSTGLSIEVYVFNAVSRMASGDGDNSCRRLAAFAEVFETDGFYISSYFSMFQAFRAAGTGDAYLFNQNTC